MIIKPLYRYQQGDITVDSLEKPDCEYVERYRLVADDDKSLIKNGEDIFTVIDIDQADLALWTEVATPETSEEDHLDLARLSPQERRAMLLSKRAERYK